MAMNVGGFIPTTSRCFMRPRRVRRRCDAELRRSIPRGACRVRARLRVVLATPARMHQELASLLLLCRIFLLTARHCRPARRTAPSPSTRESSPPEPRGFCPARARGTPDPTARPLRAPGRSCESSGSVARRHRPVEQRHDNTQCRRRVGVAEDPSQAPRVRHHCAGRPMAGRWPSRLPGESGR